MSVCFSPIYVPVHVSLSAGSSPTDSVTDRNTSKHLQQRAHHLSCFFFPFNEYFSRMRRQLHAIREEMEWEVGKKGKEIVRGRKMNRMSWQKPLTALSPCPVKRDDIWSCVFHVRANAPTPLQLRLGQADRSFIRNKPRHKLSKPGTQLLYFLCFATGELWLYYQITHNQILVTHKVSHSFTLK